jgi:PAS domain S-box-containing protein
MATHDQSTKGVTKLIDRMSDGLVAVDEEWQIEICNERARTILERSGTSVTGRDLWEVLPELVDTPLYERCQRAMDERIPEVFETTVAPIDATLSVRCFPTDGGLSIYLRNVSLSRHRETELTRYVTVVEAVSDGLVVFDDTKTVTMVNEALERLLGVSRGVIVGESAVTLDEVTRLDETDVESLVGAVEAIHAGVTERQLEFVLSDVVDRSALELRLVPLPTGSSGTVAGVFRDITARHERERVITTLHDATRQLFRTADTQEICATAVHTSADVLDLQTSGIWLLDEEHNRLEPIAATEGARENFGGLPQFTDTEGLVWDVFRAGEPELFHDVSGLADHCEFDVPIRSELIVPIGDRGVLMAGDPAPNTFDDHDLDLAELLAAHTEVALERGEKERRSQSQTAALKRRNQRLETIGDLVSGPISDILSTLEATIDDDAAAEDPLDDIHDLLEDIGHIAGTSGEPTAKEVCPLSDTVAEAATHLDCQPTLATECRVTLRADREQFVRLLVALCRIVAGDTGSTVRIDTRSGGDSPHVDQLVLKTEEDDSRDSTTAEVASDVEAAVATRIANSHGWTTTQDSAHDAHIARIMEITTLSTAPSD